MSDQKAEELCDCGKPFGHVRWNVPTQGRMCAYCFNNQVQSRSTRENVNWYIDADAEHGLTAAAAIPSVCD